MKVAILFDFIEGLGGGEKLLLFLAEKFKADIYTGYANWGKIHPKFNSHKITTIGNIPKLQFLKQELLIREFKKLDLSEYDAIICLGYYSIYASIKNHPIIWYTYGPSTIFHKKEKVLEESLPQKIGSWVWKNRIQKHDMEVVKNHIDKIVVISKYSGQRVKKYYRRKSLVIYPPVDVEKYYNKKSKGYYLVVSRLTSGKRVDLSIEAFKKMPEKTLYIEGSGKLEKHLKNLAGGAKNIKFLGRVNSVTELPELYANCTALIVTAFYDEFSMPMIEALASGKPIIAVNQGAFTEIVTDKTGILVDADTESIINGVNKMTPEVAEKMKEYCIKRAENFSIDKFYERWNKLINDVIKDG
jgi:glycosyltransferase involved in cell wall biosynthesis